MNLLQLSLFSANYELKHIADGDILFPEPKYGKFPIGANTWGHIDAAYGGPDGNALTVGAEVGNHLYICGWMFQGHVDKHYTKITSILERFQVRECALENNADKGFLKKELTKRTHISFHGYHEKMNKYYKISSYGKNRWKDVILDIDQGDIEYIAQVMDYNENASHDDAPDSFSSLVRWKFYRKKAPVKNKDLNGLFQR